jgi:aquaporin TIP
MKLALEEFGQGTAWRAAAAEFFATALFVFLGTGAVVASGAISGGADLTPARLAVIALAHGLAIMLLVAATANISGGHINPAVSIATFVSGNIGGARLVMYLVAQLVGAIVGSLLLKAIVPAGVAGNLGAHGLGPAASGAGAGFLAEIILTFALVGTVYATAIYKRGLAAYAPAAIGLAVLVDHLAGVPMTGASMNPARSFGPALIAGAWANHWIYWAGPIVGGIVAAVVYLAIFKRGEEQSS